MAQYYYLVSSLPALNPDSDQCPEWPAFRNACLSWLGPEDLAVLDQTLEAWPQSMPANPLLDAWFSWERGLRNVLAGLRAGKKQLDPALHVRPGASGDTGQFVYPVSELARQAMAAENPLAAEQILYRGRWNKLDELELGHFFDLERVLVYSLKLLQLARWKTMTAAAGEMKYQEQYIAINASFPLNLEA